MNLDHLILHLSLIDGIGPVTIATLIENSAALAPADIYMMSVRDIQQIARCAMPQAQAVVTGLAQPALLEQELNRIAIEAVSWMSLADPHYPPLLRAIYAPPPVLYWRGTFPIERKALACVGARKANEYGERAINALIPPLIAQQWIIVSGGALGADSMAHRAALAYGGVTWAVLGSGLMHYYPATNRTLFNSIIDAGGAVISQFPLSTPAHAGNFPARNRVIAGLSKGVVVVQAAEKSGARITAHFALDQGREVFAVPGLFDDPLSQGCHRLVQQGAKLVMCVQDILEEFGETVVAPAFIPAIKDEEQQMSLEIVDDSPAARVIALCQQPRTIDELLDETNLGLAELSALLFELQLQGKMQQHFTGAWQRR